MSARVNPVDVASAQGKNKELFGFIKSKFGKVPNMMRTMGQSSSVLEGYLGFAGALSSGLLTPKVRDQIALAVSQANRCEYCVSAHTLTGKLAGLTPEEALAARQGKSNDPKSQAAIDLALGILERRGDAADEQLEAARNAGWTDAELVEIVANASLTTFTNFFNQFVHTENDFPVVSLNIS